MSRWGCLFGRQTLLDAVLKPMRAARKKGKTKKVRLKFYKDMWIGLLFQLHRLNGHLEKRTKNGKCLVEYSDSEAVWSGLLSKEVGFITIMHPKNTVIQNCCKIFSKNKLASENIFTVFFSTKEYRPQNAFEVVQVHQALLPVPPCKTPELQHSHY